MKELESVMKDKYADKPLNKSLILDQDKEWIRKLPVVHNNSTLFVKYQKDRKMYQVSVNAIVMSKKFTEIENQPRYKNIDGNKLNCTKQNLEAKNKRYYIKDGKYIVDTSKNGVRYTKQFSNLTDTLIYIRENIDDKAGN